MSWKVNAFQIEIDKRYRYPDEYDGNAVRYRFCWDFADIMGWISRKDYKENCCRPFPDTYQLFACDLNPMPIFISEEFNDEYTPRKRRKRLGRLGGKSIVWEYA